MVAFLAAPAIGRQFNWLVRRQPCYGSFAMGCRMEAACIIRVRRVLRLLTSTAAKRLRLASVKLFDVWGGMQNLEDLIKEHEISKNAVHYAMGERKRVRALWSVISEMLKTDNAGSVYDIMQCFLNTPANGSRISGRFFSAAESAAAFSSSSAHVMGWP